MPPTVDTKNIATVYNTAANQLLETGTGTSNNGRCQIDFSWTTSYRSVVDFAYEVSVNSPETRWVNKSGMANIQRSQWSLWTCHKRNDGHECIR